MSQFIQGKVIVITGASSGIGFELAKQAVAQNANVILAARSLEKLEALALECGGPSRAIAVRCDVTKRSDQSALLAAALAAFGKVDVWVNNAGLGMSKTVMEVTDDDFDLMMNTNTRSVLIGMQTVVPYFKQQKSGHIINVSSLLGRAPQNASIRAMYSASKAAVNSLTCNLRCDLRTEGFSGITVSLFSPGVVKTEFGNNAMYGGPDSRTIPYAQTVEEVSALLIELMLTRKVDVYSREVFRHAVGNYFSSNDVAELEAANPLR